jgi:hypothetical protein
MLWQRALSFRVGATAWIVPKVISGVKDRLPAILGRVKAWLKT